MQSCKWVPLSYPSLRGNDTTIEETKQHDFAELHKSNFHSLLHDTCLSCVFVLTQMKNWQTSRQPFSHAAGEMTYLDTKSRTPPPPPAHPLPSFALCKDPTTYVRTPNPPGSPSYIGSYKPHFIANKIGNALHLLPCLLFGCKGINGTLHIAIGGHDERYEVTWFYWRRRKMRADDRCDVYIWGKVSPSLIWINL